MTATTTRSPMLPGALQLARRGAPVFPAEIGGKRPLTRHGFHDATTDGDTITGWWTRWPEANVAVPTGLPTTWDVLDVDVTPAGNGFGALRRLKRAGLLAGAVRIVQTPRRGLHLYFAPSGSVRNTSLAAHHLDVRGVGGYVLVPPSMVSGNGYEVIEDRPGARGSLDWEACRRLLVPPRQVTHLSHLRMSPVGDIEQLVRWMSSRTEGSRNSGLFWACCQALDTTAGRADLRPLIDAAIVAGLPAIEAGRTAASAHRRIVGAA